MKQQANPNLVESALQPEVLTPSESTHGGPDAPASGFTPLPRDSAAINPVAEVQPAVPLSEFRQSQAPTDEGATLAMPIQVFNPVKTADIPPALLPAAHLEPAQSTVSLARSSTPTEATEAPSQAPGGTWRLWLGAGLLGLLLAAGATAWYAWPNFQPRPEVAMRAATQASAPIEPEAVPPELRPYLAQAKGGDAKAMHLIALMYWNGLNVQQDRVKGLAWYQKAAAAGDKAAQKELRVIQGK